MIFRVVIYGWACDEPGCSEAWEDGDANGRALVWKRLYGYGWRVRKGKHYCPKHSGADAPSTR